MTQFFFFFYFFACGEGEKKKKTVFGEEKGREDRREERGEGRCQFVLEARRRREGRKALGAAQQKTKRRAAPRGQKVANVSGSEVEVATQAA